ncbi:hypothetical protein M0R45_034827 [Rubus argutus]|uniref:Uncharacterized protein n=1 Tax=Rubus argutus TaxID=59490 RepID=A0AAW1VSW2_RUBAR
MEQRVPVMVKILNLMGSPSSWSNGSERGLLHWPAMQRKCLSVADMLQQLLRMEKTMVNADHMYSQRGVKVSILQGLGKGPSLPSPSLTITTNYGQGYIGVCQGVVRVSIP